MRTNSRSVVAQSRDGFRAFASSFCREFMVSKDRVFNLLGKTANYESGTYRETLLRDLLSRLLPSSVSVNTGFVYGGELEKNSRQIDILIWNSAQHACIFRTENLVIVPPESVVAVISVKTSLEKKTLEESLENVTSVVPLDYRFRTDNGSESMESSVFPIRKYLVFYDNQRKMKTENVFTAVQDFYHSQNHNGLGSYYLKVQEELRKYNRDPKLFLRAGNACDRGFIKTITTIDPKSKANFYQFLQGSIIKKDNCDDPPLQPFLFRQGSIYTTALEKLVFDILQAVMIALRPIGWQSIHHWISQNPDTLNKKNTEELILNEKVCLWSDPPPARTNSAEGNSPSIGPEKHSVQRGGQRLRGEKSPTAGNRKRRA